MSSDTILEKNKNDWQNAAHEYAKRTHTDEAIFAIKDKPETAFEPEAYRYIVDRFGRELSGLKVCVPSSGDNHAVFAFALMGAEVTSCDFSANQLGYAEMSAQKLGIENSIEFIEANSMELDRLGHPLEFDIVYTSNGVWVWFDDLTAHFKGIHSILKDEGIFIACDVHPVRRPFDEDAHIYKRYDSTGPFDEEYNTLYHYRTMDVVNSIIQSGMNIRYMNEIMEQGEKSVSQQSINAFPSRLMLVCRK